MYPVYLKTCYIMIINYPYIGDPVTEVTNAINEVNVISILVNITNHFKTPD